MSDHVTWILELDVRDGQQDASRDLMEEMSSATMANEPGTHIYEWSRSADGQRVHLLERYANSDAALTHLGTFGERFATRFFTVFAMQRCTLYGAPSGTVREALATQGAVCMTPVSGFGR
jgi:quinol monooxygenase YgiN